jgi:hypothetical protein
MAENTEEQTINKNFINQLHNRSGDGEEGDASDKS